MFDIRRDFARDPGTFFLFPKEVEMIVYVREEKGYGFFSFVWDSFMVLITCGLWLIWIFVREMRRRNRSTGITL